MTDFKTYRVGLGISETTEVQLISRIEAITASDQKASLSLVRKNATVTLLTDDPTPFAALCTLVRWINICEA